MPAPNQNPESSDAQSLTQRAVRGGVWVALSTYWTFAFGFIASIFLTRILTAEDYGAYSLALFFAQLFRMQTRLGLGNAYAQHADSDATVVGTFLGLESLGAITSIILGVLALWALPAVGYSQFTSQLAFVMLLSFLFESWGNAANVILDKAMRFRQSSWLEAIIFPLSYIPAFWLAYRGAGAWSLFAQSMTRNLLTCAGKWWLGGKYLRQTLKQRLRFDWQLAKHFLKFGISVGLIAFVGILSRRLDGWMIGTFISETDLGYYNRAFRMFSWPSMLFNTLIQRIVFITYTRFYADKTRFTKVAEQITWLLLTVAVPVSLVLLLTSENLITLTYGAKWLPSVPYLQIMATASIARVLWPNASVLYTAMGNPQAMVKWGAVQLAVIIVLGLPLTLLVGARGTAVAVSVAMLISCVVAYVDLSRRQKLHLGKVIFPLLLYGAVVGLGYFLLQCLVALEFSPLIQLVLDVGYICLAWISLLMLFNGKLVLHRLRSLWQVLKHRPG